MTEQDLSLLTDEERSLYGAAYSQQHPSYYTVDAWRLVQVFDALIAARAENKRLLQKVEALVHVWDSNTRDYRLPLAVSNLRALLQSEKESE